MWVPGGGRQLLPSFNSLSGRAVERNRCPRRPDGKQFKRIKRSGRFQHSR